MNPSAMERRRNTTVPYLGVTVCKSIDLLIGTYCIANDCALLHSDRDFDPMAQHLGLRAL